MENKKTYINLDGAVVGCMKELNELLSTMVACGISDEYPFEYHEDLHLIREKCLMTFSMLSSKNEDDFQFHCRWLKRIIDATGDVILNVKNIECVEFYCNQSQKALEMFKGDDEEKKREKK